MRRTGNFQVFGVTGQIGRDGGASFAVPYALDDLADLFSAVAPVWNGLTWTGETQIKEQPSGPRYLVTATYQGIPQGGSSDGTLGGPREDGEWEIDPADEEVPIERHPNLRELMNDFGGYFEDGKVKFPETLGMLTPSPTGLFGNPQVMTRGGLTRAQYSPGDPNPAYGLESFLRPGCTVRRTRVLSTVPADMMQRAREVVETLPIQALRHIDWHGHNWLTKPPRPSSFGASVRYVEEWVMSPPGGWDPVHVRMTYVP
jgi:hypothetical protein